MYTHKHTTEGEAPVGRGEGQILGRRDGQSRLLGEQHGCHGFLSVVI